MRSVGIDPGSRHVAITVIDVDAFGAEYVNFADLDVGEQIDDPALARIRLSAATFLFANVPDPADSIVTVERVKEVHKVRRFDPAGGKIEGVSVKMIAYMLASEWIGGEIASAARSMFGEHAHRIGTCGRSEWSRAIVKHRATDNDVAKVVTAAIKGWPKRSNAHHRDGGGIALFGANRWRVNPPSKEAIRSMIHADAKRLPAFGGEDDDRSFPSGPCADPPGTV